MNERIKELLGQAGGIEHDEDGNELTPILVGKDLVKFAELIVRECAEIAKDTQDFYNEHNDGIINTEIWTMIKYRFGVDN